MPTAYLLLAIDTRSLKVVGAKVFSENRPTTTGAVVPTEILSVTRDSYHEARNAVLETAQSLCPWVKELLPEEDRW